MIKKNSKDKLCSGKAMRALGAVGVSAMLLFGASGCGVLANVYELPEQREVTERLLAIYGTERKMFLLERLGQVPRLPCVKSQDFIPINILFDMKKTEQILFEDVVDEFNEVFAKINPNYKFKINYPPSSLNSLKLYSINVSKEKLEGHVNLNGKSATVQARTTPMLLDISSTIEGREICSTDIVINSDMFFDYESSHGTNYYLNKSLRSVFVHEFCHALGLGDAYISNVSADTVMQAVTLGQAETLTSLDVATLAALYYQGTEQGSAELIEFIQNYDKNNKHLNFEEEYIINNINPLEIKNAIINSDYSNSTKNKVISNLGSINKNFNPLYKSFGESAKQGQEKFFLTMGDKECNLQLKDEQAVTGSRYHLYDGILFVPQNKKTKVMLNVGENLIEFSYNLDDLSFDYSNLTIYQQTDKTKNEYFGTLEQTNWREK